MLLIKLVEPKVNETTKKFKLPVNEKTRQLESERKKYLLLKKEEYCVCLLENDGSQVIQYTKEGKQYNTNELSEFFPVACSRKEVYFYKKGFIEECLRNLLVLGKEFLGTIGLQFEKPKLILSKNEIKKQIKKSNSLINSKLEEKYPEENLQFFRKIGAELCDFYICKLYGQEKDADNVKKTIAEILQEKSKPFYEAPSKDLLLSGAELFTFLTEMVHPLEEDYFFSIKPYLAIEVLLCYENEKYEMNLISILDKQIITRRIKYQK